ncbi:response regulator [Paenibacillus lentus]|uniref:Response regulator n=1 Tax=Paenibacillus lentus TaxID=1338368 RepID=A0A3Q8SEA1_9BACL|nr:response regulator [Paenibacillus lentus]AZK48536.1 response regulator [Paenibacillus lentus]
MIRTIIVDDEKMPREMIKRYGSWDEYGMEIIGEADDGLEALRLIEDRSPQLVITDMRMPGADGMELLGILKERYPATKVIVVSGYDDFTYLRQAIRCKAKDYILKPIDPQELNAALLKCKKELESSRQISRQQFTLQMDFLQIAKGYKPALTAYYNRLDTAGVRSTFQKLLRELNDYEATQAKMQAQIYQEFMVLLRELMVANSQTVNGFQFEIRAEALQSYERLFNDLTELYLLAMSQLEEHRKYRRKLNLAEIKQYVEANYCKPITLEQIAGAFFVSKEYLSRAFKNEFKQNLSDYIQQLRMEKSKKLLLEGEQPIRAIAESCGYEEVAYFYRVFKKHFGVAPGEMRKER